jgi:hypothetical protein
MPSPKFKLLNHTKRKKQNKNHTQKKYHLRKMKENEGGRKAEGTVPLSQ